MITPLLVKVTVFAAALTLPRAKVPVLLKLNAAPVATALVKTKLPLFLINKPPPFALASSVATCVDNTVATEPIDVPALNTADDAVILAGAIPARIDPVVAVTVTIPFVLNT